MSTILKQRAKRLRNALGDLFDIRVSLSQSLELIAHEEGYSNWDAASACYDRSPVTSTLPSNQASDRLPSPFFEQDQDDTFDSTLCLPVGVRLTVHRQINKSAKNIFGRANARALDKIIYNLKYSSGSLTIFSGAPGSGRKTTQEALINEFLNKSHEPVRVCVYDFKIKFGLHELSHDYLFIQDNIDHYSKADLYVFGEINHPKIARRAFELANTGHNVFVVLRSDLGLSSIDIYKRLLLDEEIGFDDSTLKAFEEAHMRNMIMTIHQRLVG
ncbi:glyoxalase superfamily protein [Pseudomonas luteola]